AGDGDDGEGDGDDAAAEPEPAAPEAVAAAAQTPRTPPARRPAAVPAPARARAADPVERRPRGSLVASAEMPGMQIGQDIDRLTLAQAMIRKRESFRGGIPAGVEMEKHTLATFSTDWSAVPERVLDADPIANWDKIQAVVGEEALAASGGLCAP